MLDKSISPLSSAHDRRHDGAPVQGEQNEQVLRGRRLGNLSAIVRLIEADFTSK